MSCRRPAMSGGLPNGSGSTSCGARRVQGSLRLALISGEAGVGKTRLATHLALQVRGEGATVLYGRCDEDLGVPYQPWCRRSDTSSRRLRNESWMPKSSAMAVISRV